MQKFKMPATAHEDEAQNTSQAGRQCAHLPQGQPGLGVPLELGEPAEQDSHEQEQQVQLDEGAHRAGYQDQRVRGPVTKRRTQHDDAMGSQGTSSIYYIDLVVVRRSGTAAEGFISGMMQKIATHSAGRDMTSEHDSSHMAPNT